MKYTEEHLKNGGSRITIDFHELDFCIVKLDRWDRALLAECNASDKISDKLLALETIARRLEENKSISMRR